MNAAGPGEQSPGERDPYVGWEAIEAVWGKNKKRTKSPKNNKMSIAGALK